METSVIMQRELLGCLIRQNSKTEFLCSTDLVIAGNKWRAMNGLRPIDFGQWKNQATTKDFISELERQYGKVIISGNGRGNPTWVHPFLFLDLALSLNPKFKVEVYKWLYDCLLKYINSSGDSYKIMAGALYENTSQKTKFSESMKKLANIIKNKIGVDDWQKATEEQLQYRDKIHEYISIACGMIKKNNNEAIRIGILEAEKWKNRQ